MDYYITQEGKRQAGQGQLNVKFASFTDYHTFYETSGSLTQPTLSDNATDRIFFECYSRPQDVIVPEIESTAEGGVMRPFSSQDFKYSGGLVSSGTLKQGFVYTPDVMLSVVETTSDGNTQNISTGLDLKASQQILNGITKNFSEQRIIGSIDEFSSENKFELSKPSQVFTITNKTKYERTKSSSDVASVDDTCPSLFFDGRFKSFPNFAYLPPVNLPEPGSNDGTPLGFYPNFNEKSSPTSIEELQKFLSDKQKIQINFNKTSRSNNFICQVFETSSKQFVKLDVIDAGVFDDEDPNSAESFESPGRRVFYLGKFIRDSKDTDVFLRIFTVVID